MSERDVWVPVNDFVVDGVAAPYEYTERGMMRLTLNPLVAVRTQIEIGAIVRRAAQDALRHIGESRTPDQ